MQTRQITDVTSQLLEGGKVTAINTHLTFSEPIKTIHLSSYPQIRVASGANRERGQQTFETKVFGYTNMFIRDNLAYLDRAHANLDEMIEYHNQVVARIRRAYDSEGSILGLEEAGVRDRI